MDDLIKITDYVVCFPNLESDGKTLHIKEDPHEVIRIVKEALEK